jgi:hypothetical protein
MNKKLFLYGTALISALFIGIGLYMVLYRQTSTSISTPPVPYTSSSGSLMVDQQWQYIGKFSGKILIEMSGKATLAPNRQPISPDGINEAAPNGFTVPGISQYCSIAKVNGEIQKVGSRRELVVNGDLYLGVNEDAQSLYSNSFADNSGSWEYKISTSQPAQQENTSAIKTIKVPSTVMWFDTGIDIPDNKEIKIEYKAGHWRNSATSGYNAGEGRSPFDRQNLLIVSTAPLSSLVGKVGEKTFFVNNSFQGNVGSGKLYLSINDIPDTYNDNEGTLTVTVEVK